MLRHILTIAGACAGVCILLYVWWQGALRSHEFREKLFGDRDKFTTLFGDQQKPKNK